MLKKRIQLPKTEGNFCFSVTYRGALPQKRALLVIRPIDEAGVTKLDSNCSLTWSKAANGFFAYNSGVSVPKTVVSRNFDIEFSTRFIEIEVLPWGTDDLSSRISDVSLVVPPTQHDAKYTTFAGEPID